MSFSLGVSNWRSSVVNLFFYSCRGFRFSCANEFYNRKDMFLKSCTRVDLFYYVDVIKRNKKDFFFFWAANLRLTTKTDSHVSLVKVSLSR